MSFATLGTRRTAATFVATLLLGCGAIQPTLNYEGFGAADPERDQAMVQKLRETEPPPVGSEVVVLVDTIPEGINLDDGAIKVEDGYQHQLLGKFALLPGAGGFVSAISFPDYKDSWRKGYCYWQAPLGWVTLTLWTFLVPLNYPCWGDASMEKKDAVAEAKQVAKAAGGDLVIMTYAGAGLGGDANYVYGAVGFILKVDPRMKQGDIKTKPADGPTKDI